MTILDNDQLRLIFPKFLQSKGAWTAFCNNVWHVPEQDRQYCLHNRDLNILFERIYPYEWIIGAFNWATTKEHQTIDPLYWKKIDDEWQDFLFENDKA